MADKNDIVTDFLVLLTDIIMVGIFAYLSIYFGKWWISLFAICFIFTNKHDNYNRHNEHNKHNKHNKHNTSVSRDEEVDEEIDESMLPPDFSEENLHV